MRALLLSGTILAVSLLSAGAQGNLVFNGTFDTSTAGWAVTNSLGSGFARDYGYPKGALGLDGTGGMPTASQIINGLTPGNMYLLSADYLCMGGKVQKPGASFGMAVDGSYLYQAMGVPGTNWHNFSVTYQATAPSAVLSFAAYLNGSDYGYLLDNVSMIEVPEAGSGWLLISGGVVALVCRRALSRREEDSCVRSS